MAVQPNQEDNRRWITHKIHQWGHEINGYWKEKSGKPGIESLGIYRSISPGKNGRVWTSEIDWKRASYHKTRSIEKCNIF